MVIRLAALVTAAAFSMPLAAQTASLAGTVVRDTAGAGIPEAQISFPSLGRSAVTNYAGEFRIDGLPAGRHLVQVRRIGFRPLNDSVTLAAGNVLDVEFVMPEQPLALDSQRVTAAARSTQPFLDEFEARRKSGFGHFVEPDDMRKIDNHNFVSSIATRLPGMTIIRKAGTQLLASGRKPCVGPAFQCTGAEPCYVSVYIDGVAQYVAGVTNGPPTDFSNYKSDDFAAMEYYSSGSTAPPQFSGTGSDCGVLLLWRRYR
jgi:hypothetical protein